MAAEKVADQPVYVGIRPEGFELCENGTFACKGERVEVMGRDISVICKHEAAHSDVIRAIIEAEHMEDAEKETLRFSLEPHKVFLFHKETEERIYL